MPENRIFIYQYRSVFHKHYVMWGRAYARRRRARDVRRAAGKSGDVISTPAAAGNQDSG
jgi:hypothetical protein